MRNRNTEFDGIDGYFWNFFSVPKNSVYSVKFRVAISLFLFLPAIIFAQEGYEHLSPIAHGAGRTYVVTSRGLSSVGLNPALLGFDIEKNLEVQIFPISAYGLDAGSEFSDVNAFKGLITRIKKEIDINQGSVSDSTRKHISDLFSNGKLEGRGDAEILGVSYKVRDIGTFAFTWTTHSAARVDVPQSFVDFFRNAESKLLQDSNSFENLDLQGLWYNEYSLSFGKVIEIGKDTSDVLRSLAVGGALKYASGIAYVRVNDGNYIRTAPRGGRVLIWTNYDEFSSYSPNFTPNNIENSSTFDFISSNSAGTGFGADIGVCAGFLSNKHGTPTVLLGISVTDIGAITWNKNASERSGDHLFDSIVYENATAIKDVTDSLKKFTGVSKDISSFTTSLPTMFRAGLMIDLDAMGFNWGSFGPRIAIEYANGLTGLVGSLKNSRLGAGLTLERPGNVGLRLNGGFVIESGASDITLGIGLTIFKFFDIDIATAHLTQLFSSNSRTDLAIAIRAAF